MFIYFRGGVKSEKRRSVGGEVKKIPQKRAGGVPVRFDWFIALFPTRWFVVCCCFRCDLKLEFEIFRDNDRRSDVVWSLFSNGRMRS